MLTDLFNGSALNILTKDGWLLLLTRFTRLFAYGALSVILVLYLTSLGLSEPQTGMHTDASRRYRCFPISNNTRGSDRTPSHAHRWRFSHGGGWLGIRLHE